MAAKHQIPGYEILAQLGRGGMGVVYKAKQIKLDRLVALKMILSGPYAGAKELARFRTEAEAVARLQHPNIVPIYEVGQHHGRPFVVLEYVDGGSLDNKLQDQPQPPWPAAHLVETLARAMHAAHERGIVHRDLKPGNILLASGACQPPDSRADKDPGGSQPPLAECIPKITDFGLAKMLDEETGQTATGEILGTPSYMAPEQAEGRVRDIGAAADVHALGAILYELLTGRPPFRSATPQDTIVQLVVEPPIPPSRWQPKVPRDLETICLKCLEKKPEDRYASALALAEDLSRFQAGEPIQARPLGLVSKTICWVKRRRELWLMLIGALGALAVFLLWPKADPTGVPKPNPTSLSPVSPEVVRGDNTPLPSKTFTNGLGMKFVRVSKGTFWMGGADGKPGDEQVEIKEDFYLGATTVTQGQWRAVLGNNPSWFSRKGGGADKVKDISDGDLDQFPVEQVSWEEVQEFLTQLNKKELISEWLYRLPTEAQWEYACRGGATSKEDCSVNFYLPRHTNDLSSEDANFNGDLPIEKSTKGKYLGRPCRVASYQPNRLRLYDMHGNVWQWCDDKYVAGGLNQVFRGGGWRDAARSCRAAHRRGNAPDYRDSDLGFRLALVPSPSKGK